MIPNKQNTPCQLRFTVLDVNNAPVTGINTTEFAVRIYDPVDAEVSGSVSLVRKELGSGDYEITFTPGLTGRWYVVVSHATHFPWGKAASVYVESSLLSDIEIDIAALQSSINAVAADLTFVHDIEGGRWKIDRHTKQMRFYKADNITEVACFDLYDAYGDPATEDVYERRRASECLSTTTTSSTTSTTSTTSTSTSSTTQSTSSTSSTTSTTSTTTSSSTSSTSSTTTTTTSTTSTSSTTTTTSTTSTLTTTSSSSTTTTSSSTTTTSTSSSTSSTTSSSTTTTTAAGASWHDYTDTTYWSAGPNTTWTGSQWDESGPPQSMRVNEAGTWNEGFEPEKCRITGTFGGSATITVRDSSNNVIGSAAAAAQVEIDLDFDTGQGDIDHILLYGMDNVTAIEFWY